MKNRATVFSENLSAIAENCFAIVPIPDLTPMPNQPESTLAEYVKRIMRENGLKYADVAKTAKRRGGSIGTSTIQQIASDGTPNPGIYTLLELSWGLNRPVEELLACCLGEALIEGSTFKKTDYANLWDLQQQLPAAEQRAMKRYLQMMEREMRRVLMQLAESDQLVALGK